MLNSTQTIFLDFSNLHVHNEFADIATDVLDMAISKVSNAYEGTNVEFVTTKPNSGDYSTLDINNIIEDSYLHFGDAEIDIVFDPNDDGVIRFDNIFDFSAELHLPVENFANLIAHNISHISGHLMGLEHSTDPNSVMNKYVDPNNIDTPPFFSIDEVQSINTNAVIANTDLEQVNEIRYEKGLEDFIEFEEKSYAPDEESNDLNDTEGDNENLDLLT
ncbi:matrixin family metalloprotease [candidate division KSB1 bacterium]